MEVHIHFIHECVDSGKINVEYISISNQHADIVRFQELRDHMGMIKVK